MTWPCEAYGFERGEQVGAWCFIAGQLHARVCGTPADCAAAMTLQRQRIFRRMHELAAAGDPVWADLSNDFTNPDQIFGGGGKHPYSDDDGRRLGGGDPGD